MAEITQSGDLNSASLTQSWSNGGNEASISQSLSGNVATVVQGGLVNGDFNSGNDSATVVQNGLNNVASVLQQ
ncbi:hypothetical protein ACFQDN_08300 [Pseudomonas asuensis]|jgi:hypothetical protein|uniref:Uncharacterized protein n=2 Tax=Pseudomonas TaxID=286 RepID=A0ABQ2GWJ5_9PSED|nr:hypothetical protein [Pseudomonas asuensis]GGM14564.1 hypothetical protein GCM10009425_27010 [Pseudomonas asuensis]